MSEIQRINQLKGKRDGSAWIAETAVVLNTLQEALEFLEGPQFFESALEYGLRYRKSKCLPEPLNSGVHVGADLNQFWEKTRRLVLFCDMDDCFQKLGIMFGLEIDWKNWVFAQKVRRAT